jgi:hypothetical protein
VLVMLVMLVLRMLVMLVLRMLVMLVLRTRKQPLIFQNRYIDV